MDAGWVTLTTKIILRGIDVRLLFLAYIQDISINLGTGRFVVDV